MQGMNFSTFKKLTRIEQTFFNLPFILAAALLPFLTDRLSIYWHFAWLWILPAFMAARTSGMAFNQLIDRHIDALNPRTKDRVVASGRLKSKSALYVALTSWLLFLFFCSQINKASFYLALLAAPLLPLYSYTKRVTPLCHYVLGIIHFLGPLTAWVAITGEFSLVPLLLSFVSFCLIVGMDIVYAIQDVGFDQEKGLFSIPSRLGVQKALWIARTMHFFCVLSLISLGIVCQCSLIYFLAPLVGGSTFLFLYLRIRERLQKSSQLFGIEPLFFYCTLIISFSTLVFVLLGCL